MSKRKIIFRADGGKEVGMGHFIRTLALAEMLNDFFYCIFAIQKPSKYQISEIKNICNEWLPLPDDETHSDVFLNYLKGDEIVVLDNYYFSTDYQRTIRAKGCKLVCIDDIHDKHYVADIVINHAEGLYPSLYSSESYTKILLGYKYALLRKEYLTIQKLKPKYKYSCLLMMGGSDPLKLTIKFASILNNLSEPIAVVVGAGFEEDQDILQLDNIVLFKGIASSHVKQIMQESIFGILPASTVSVEACAARLPFICGYFVNNQKEIYSGIKKGQLAVCVGNFLTLKKEKLIAAIEEIRNPIILENIKQKQIEKLDKKSKKRFLKEFQTL